MWAENHILISDSLGGFDPGGLKSPGLECGMWVWGCKCKLEERKSGWGSLMGCRLWGSTELDTTEAT